MSERNVTSLRIESANLHAEVGERDEIIHRQRKQLAQVQDALERRNAENAKLREQVDNLQPRDCEGDALDIADTVHMLRSEYDGDHEWDDVVVELALTKWGGDRWIVRGSRGEAWACDCRKTGHDEEAYEDSDDAEPIDNYTLVEAENAKLRELVGHLMAVKPRDVTSIFFNGQVLRFDDLLEEVGLRWEDTEHE